VPEFERDVAVLTGSRHAVAVNSGTSALHLSVKATGFGEGDEVITTPFSFVASANSILFERGQPVFVDIDPETYNIDPKAIEAAITPVTKAILPMHIFGRPCRIGEVKTIAENRGLALIEDACETIGATYQSKTVGSFGNTGTLAFYPNKQVTSGEGGMIVTNDSSVAAPCRSWRNQGRAETTGEHHTLGFNYRLSDIHYALGVSQLLRLGEILRERERVARLYDAALRDVNEVIRPHIFEPEATIAWFVYVVRLSDEFGAAQRDQIIAFLQETGVGCRNYFPPIHLQPFYVEHFGYRTGDFPATEFVSERTIALSFYNRLSELEVEFVNETLRKAIGDLKRKSFASA